MHKPSDAALIFKFRSWECDKNQLGTFKFAKVFWPPQPQQQLLAAHMCQVCAKNDESSLVMTLFSTRGEYTEKS